MTGEAGENVNAWAKTVERAQRIHDFVREIADEECSYRDDCPSSARHYVCLRCRALRVLAE